MAFDPSQAYLNVVMAWIRFPGLPGYLYKHKILAEIREMVGKVVKLDMNIDSRMGGFFARLAVYVNLERPLVSQILINGRPQRVEINVEKETASPEMIPENHNLVEDGKEREKEGSHFRALNNRNLNQELTTRDIADHRRNKGKEILIENQQRSLIPTKERPNSLGLGGSSSAQARSLLDQLRQGTVAQNLLAGTTNSTGNLTAAGDSYGQEIGGSLLNNDGPSVNLFAPISSMEGRSTDELVAELGSLDSDKQSVVVVFSGRGRGVKSRGRCITKKLNKVHSSSSNRFKTNGSQRVLLKDSMVQLAESISTLTNDKPGLEGPSRGEAQQKGGELPGQIWDIAVLLSLGREVVLLSD
ncbi:hypothetical protein Goari_000891 [Gossypium aridum]|uniref:DUF4283 domain-containing protein n=1 Tax=Gossypium aridum TaxID=34290 RepID=A0A7J8YI17_GOSAI|nr:hypothetical protein [Gossypium aridum]